MSARVIGQLRSESGISLILVLWVIALLMIVVLEFTYTMRVESSTVRNFKDEQSAYYLASAGVNMAVVELSGIYTIVHAGADGSLVFRTKGADVEVTPFERDFRLGEGRVSYAVFDERGKVNINTASREILDDLLRSSGVNETDRDGILDSITDWKDQNQEYHMNGAEDDYYESLAAPYQAKDAPFDTIEELLLVKGMTPEIFYGTGNVPPEFGVPGRAASSGSSYLGIADLVTVFGDGKININTADERVLDAVYGKGRSLEIMLRRETEGYYERPEYGGVITSDTFTVLARGEVRGLTSVIRATVKRGASNAPSAVLYWSEGGINSY